MYDQLKDRMYLKLQINIDGLPLFKSSRVQFWPIIGMLQGFCHKVQVAIALYCSSSKPKSVADFLQYCIQDINCLSKAFSSMESN